MSTLKTAPVLKDKTPERLASVIVQKSKGKISKQRALNIANHLDLTSFYEVLILTSEKEAEEFLTMTEQKEAIRGQGIQRFFTEAGTIIEGQLQLGQRFQMVVNEEIVESEVKQKVIPSNNLKDFVVLKTRQIFNTNNKLSSVKDNYTDYIIGIYII